MGWSVKKGRDWFPRTRLVPAERAERVEHDTYVVDVASVVQSSLVGTCTLTPYEYTCRFLWDPAARYPRVVYCFDAPGNMPLARKTILYPKRYKKEEYTGERPGFVWVPAPRSLEGGGGAGAGGRYHKPADVPVSEEVADRIAPHFLPAPWSNIRTSAVGKARAYRVIEQCIDDLVAKNAAEGREIIVYRTDGTGPGPTASYGEGDQRATHVALEFAGPPGELLEPERAPRAEDDPRPAGRVLCHSGDWDIRLALLGFHHTGIECLIRTVFVERGFEEDQDAPRELTRKGAVKRWREGYTPMREIMGTDMPFEEPGGRSDAGKRLCYLFWALCAGGADYCDSIARFGFSETPVRTHAIASSAAPGGRVVERVFDEDDPTRKGIRFYPDRFIAQLKTIKRNVKRKNFTDCADDLSSVVIHILFQIRYYLGFDSHQGGPPPPPSSSSFSPASSTLWGETPEGAPRTVTALLTWRAPLLAGKGLAGEGTLDLWEDGAWEHPPYPPETLYHGAQLDAVRAALRPSPPGGSPGPGPEPEPPRGEPRARGSSHGRAEPGLAGPALPVGGRGPGLE